MNIWDYFMRRKPLLLAVLTCFFASSFASYRLLQHGNQTEITQISISDWGDSIVTVAYPVEVMSPRDLVQLPPASMEPEYVADADPAHADPTEFEEDFSTATVPETPADLAAVVVPATATAQSASRLGHAIPSFLLGFAAIFVAAFCAYSLYWEFLR